MEGSNRRWAFGLTLRPKDFCEQPIYFTRLIDGVAGNIVKTGEPWIIRGDGVCVGELTSIRTKLGEKIIHCFGTNAEAQTAVATIRRFAWRFQNRREIPWLEEVLVDPGVSANLSLISTPESKSRGVRSLSPNWDSRNTQTSGISAIAFSRTPHSTS